MLKNASLYGVYPGNQVYLTSYTGNTNSNLSPVFYKLSGTSMAAPVVSGAVALLLQKQPTLTPDQVKARLMKTASKSFPMQSTATDPTTGITYVDQYDVFTIGAGYLDIAAALASTDLATSSAASPIATFDGTSGNTYLVFGSNAVCFAHRVPGGLVLPVVVAAAECETAGRGNRSHVTDCASRSTTLVVRRKAVGIPWQPRRLAGAVG